MVWEYGDHVRWWITIVHTYKQLTIMIIMHSPSSYTASFYIDMRRKGQGLHVGRTDPEQGCTWVEQIKRWIIVWMLGDARCSMKALERMGKIIRVSYSTKGNNCSFNMWCVDKTGLRGIYTRVEQCLICPHSLILLWNAGLAFSREDVEVGDSDNWVVVGVLSDSDNSFTVGKLYDSHKWVIVGVIYYSDNWVTVGFVVR